MSELVEAIVEIVGKREVFVRMGLEEHPNFGGSTSAYILARLKEDTRFAETPLTAYDLITMLQHEPRIRVRPNLYGAICWTCTPEGIFRRIFGESHD